MELTRRQRLAHWLQDHTDPSVILLAMTAAVGATIAGIVVGSTPVIIVGVAIIVIGSVVTYLGEYSRP